MTAETTLARARRRVAEKQTIDALRAGEECAFRHLVERADPMMRRLAHNYVDSAAVVDEVVQDSWMAIFTGIHRFRGNSALDTWIFSILIKQAKTHRARERRALPFSEFETANPVDLFQTDQDARAGVWAIPPRPWESSERRLLSLETRAQLRSALSQLSERQRVIVALRDVEGLSATEVSAMLELSPGNQRVLLHRARSRLRGILESDPDRDAPR